MNINLSLFGQMITFAILVYFTMRYIWPPLMAAIEERQQKIAEGLNAAEQGQKQLQQAQSEGSQIIADARAKAGVIMREAEASAKSLINDAQQDARSKAQKVMEQAQHETELFKQKAKHELSDDTIEAALTLLDKVLLTESGKFKDLMQKMLKEGVRS